MCIISLLSHSNAKVFPPVSLLKDDGIQSEMGEVMCELVLAFSPGLFPFSSPGTFGLL